MKIYPKLKITAFHKEAKKNFEHLINDINEIEKEYMKNDIIDLLPKSILKEVEKLMKYKRGIETLHNRIFSS